MFFPFHIRVYLVAGNTDMRKSINGLFILVSEHLEMDSLSGHFVWVLQSTAQNDQGSLLLPQRILPLLAEAAGEADYSCSTTE